jgi:hypothetical protein
MDINNSQDTWQAESASSFLETLEALNTVETLETPVTLPAAPETWDESEEYDPQAESRLIQAKATRDQAEAVRQKVAEQILEATREKCQELLISGNNALKNAKRLEAEADMWHFEAQEQLKQAESVRVQADAERNTAHNNARSLENEAETRRSEAQASLKQAETVEAQSEANRERILADAHRAARDIIDTARMESKQERMESDRLCLELKHQATLEAQRILAQARAIREELEAHRIYADAARLKAWSDEILMQVDEQPDQARVSPGPATNGDTFSTDLIHGTQPEDLDQPTSVEPVSSRAPSRPEQSAASNNGKRSARATQAANLARAASVEPASVEAPSELG